MKGSSPIDQSVHNPCELPDEGSLIAFPLLQNLLLKVQQCTHLVMSCTMDGGRPEKVSLASTLLVNNLPSEGKTMASKAVICSMATNEDSERSATVEIVY